MRTAFRLVRQGDGATVALTADVDDLGASTVVTLNFVGGAVDPLRPIEATSVAVANSAIVAAFIRRGVSQSRCCA